MNGSEEPRIRPERPNRDLWRGKVGTRTGFALSLHILRRIKSKVGRVNFRTFTKFYVDSAGDTVAAREIVGWLSRLGRSGQPPTIHNEAGARDPLGHVACEKEHRVCHIVRGANP